MWNFKGWCRLHANLSPDGLLYYIGGQGLHFRMDAAIRVEQFTSAWTKRFARKIGNHSALFFHEQCSRRRVPRLQSKFPESFETSGCYTTKIERGRSITPYAV